MIEVDLLTAKIVTGTHVLEAHAVEIRNGRSVALLTLGNKSYRSVYALPRQLPRVQPRPARIRSRTLLRDGPRNGGVSDTPLLGDRSATLALGDTLTSDATLQIGRLRHTFNRHGAKGVAADLRLIRQRSRI